MRWAISEITCYYIYFEDILPLQLSSECVQIEPVMFWLYIVYILFKDHIGKITFGPELWRVYKYSTILILNVIFVLIIADVVEVENRSGLLDVFLEIQTCRIIY